MNIMDIRTPMLCLLLTCLALLNCVDEVSARGARVRVRVRSSSSSYRAARYASVPRVRYSGYVAAAAAGYYIWGMSRYNHRYYGTRYYRNDPPICTNLDRYATYDNGTISTTQKLEFFVCPYDDDDEPDDVYCCGDDYEEECCDYWESPGRVAGAVIGMIIALVFVIIVIVLIIKCCRRGKSGKHHAQETHLMTPPAAATFSSTPQPPYPTAPGPTGYTGAPAPGYVPPGEAYAPQGPGYPPPAYYHQQPPSVPSQNTYGFEAMAPPTYQEQIPPKYN